MINGLKQFQTVMVIGGKSEIAYEIVRNIPLMSQAKVFLLGRNIDTKNILIPGAETVLINYDLNDDFLRIQEVSSLFAKQDFDLVIFAAGYLGAHRDKSIPKEFAQIINTNFSQTAQVLHCVTTHLLQQKHGKILILSTVASIRPRSINYIYGASKAGIDFLARGIQLVLDGSGVTLHIARLGFVHSRMTQGVTPAPFAISVARAGQLCAKGIRKSKKIFYVPGILRYVMFIIRLLPTKVLKRLN